MRIALGILAALGVSLAGLIWGLWPHIPPEPPLRGSLHEGALPVDGLERRYEFYLPAELEPEPPLLFVIHGSGIDPAATRQWCAGMFRALADREGLVLVYPFGFELEWNGCRNPGVTEADRRDLDDVGFIAGLIERFAASHAIDTDRIYAVGFSNGGQMVYRLASDAPERFAALAVLIAQVPAPENSDCPSPAGRVPILIMNGTADPIIPWEGGTASLFGFSARGRVLSTDESVAHWREVNGIANDAPERVDLPDRDPDDGSTVERATWRNPATGDEVVLVTVRGGGHAIPGGIEPGLRPISGRVLGYVNRDINTAEELWHFFQRHSQN